MQLMRVSRHDIKTREDVKDHMEEIKIYMRGHIYMISFMDLTCRNTSALVSERILKIS